jgi:DNA (cytosine-5)-methyltransferase 1
VTPLVLSLFPGIGLLDMAFEEEGFCVVRGPDLLWGGDIRKFHPPAGKFDGVIGGPPCQEFSTLSNLVRAKGLQPRFGNLVPEFNRIVVEAAPAWFLMENVPRAEEPAPSGFLVARTVIDNSWLGEPQRRRRAFWFGIVGYQPVNLWRYLHTATLELMDAPAVCGDARRVPVKLGGSGKIKRSAVTGTHPCARRPKGGHGEIYTLAEMLELQGLPSDFLDECPLTISGKRKAIGNGVPLPMGRAVAQAVKRAIGLEVAA